MAKYLYKLSFVDRYSDFFHVSGKNERMNFDRQYIRATAKDGLVAEWLACWTQAQ